MEKRTGGLKQRKVKMDRNAVREQSVHNALISKRQGKKKNKKY